MARPNKNGLDYFPFDIDMFDDEKMLAISGEFGIKGEITVIKLLCAIYRNGYFIAWNDLLKYKLLRTLPTLSAELIENIVSRLVKWEFFDENLFNSMGVLTSRGIQIRYFDAAKRRNTGNDLPYLLINVGNNGVNVCNNQVTEHINQQRKVKESKVIKEEKKEESKADTNKRFFPPSVEEVTQYISEKKYSVDAESFVAFYQSKNWYVGKNKMKDWHAALVTWATRDKEKPTSPNQRKSKSSSNVNDIWK